MVGSMETKAPSGSTIIMAVFLHREDRRFFFFGGAHEHLTSTLTLPWCWPRPLAMLFLERFFFLVLFPFFFLFLSLVSQIEVDIRAAILFYCVLDRFVNMCLARFIKHR